MNRVMRSSQPTVQTVVAHEVDDTASAFGYKAVRLGLGNGPTVHRQIELDGVSVQSGSIGFPTAGRLTLPDDQISVAWCVTAPPGTLWNEHDFTPGTMISWGPGSEATWLNREGVAVQIAFVDEQAIRSIADALEERITMPEPGAVVRMPESTRVRRLGALLASFGDPLDTSAVLPASPTALLGSLTHVLAENAHRAPATRARGLDSRSLVTTCVRCRRPPLDRRDVPRGPRLGTPAAQSLQRCVRHGPGRIPPASLAHPGTQPTSAGRHLDGHRGRVRSRLGSPRPILPSLPVGVPRGAEPHARRGSTGRGVADANSLGLIPSPALSRPTCGGVPTPDRLRAPHTPLSASPGHPARSGR